MQNRKLRARNAVGRKVEKLWKAPLLSHFYSRRKIVKGVTLVLAAKGRMPTHERVVFAIWRSELNWDENAIASNARGQKSAITTLLCECTT